MSHALTFLMAQINPTVGAIEDNAEKIIQIIQIHQETHDVIIFPELALTGYPPEDLLFRKELFTRTQEALTKICAASTDAHVILGHPITENDQRFNALSVFYGAKLISTYHKQHLPNDGVFDEQRYFKQGAPKPCILTLKGHRMGLCICQDIWEKGPVEQLVKAGASLMICINASPFDENKYATREILLKKHTQRGLSIIYVNQVGGQDELVFDGQSLALDNTGQLVARAPAFLEDLQTVTLNEHGLTGNITPLLETHACLYEALVCGLRDYVNKNKFPGVLLGLSGGIDSALTLAIAVDALGAHRVHAVMMPSRYTATMSAEDAHEQLALLNVQHTTLSIEPTFNTLLSTLTPAFDGRAPDVTEENLQARIRGLLLMALSNKTGHMLLTTSNKSETAVGYATLYGDMNGGFSVLKDVLKTRVYALANYRNTKRRVIPERVIQRAPSAELAMNQTDQDSLPDYPLLDSIIQHYMHEGLDAKAIIERGYPHDVVSRVIGLIKRNEYKRRQAAPGVKITPCAFDKDWRFPITSGF